jgi:hypothetical protein
MFWTGQSIFKGRYIMGNREVNLRLESTAKAKFRELKRESFLVGNHEFRKALNTLLNQAELNAANTDFAQDERSVDEHFWQTVVGSISDLLCSAPLAVRNWFALHGLFG